MCLDPVSRREVSFSRHLGLLSWRQESSLGHQWIHPHGDVFSEEWELFHLSQRLRVNDPRRVLSRVLVAPIKHYLGTSEMPGWIKVLAAMPDDLSLMRWWKKRTPENCH